MSKETINGFAMRYEVRGNGFPVAFIHGGFGGMNSTLVPRNEPWVPAFLDAGYQVVTYDRRSAGDSDYPENGYSLENLAEDLRELLRHLRIERAHIMGSSAGGPIALTYALQHPETVHALVLINTGPALISEPRVVERMRARLELLDQDGPSAAYEARREQPLGLQEMMRRRAAGGTNPQLSDQVLAALKAFQERLRNTSREDRIRWYAGEARNYGAYLGVDLTERLGELKMPAFVIHGDADSIVPVEGGKTLGQRIPDAKLEILAGAEHGLMTNASKAPARIVEFLAGVAGAQER